MHTRRNATLRLRARPAGHADLHECLGLLPPWLGLDPATREALPAIWTRLLGSSGMNADVTDDLSRPPGQRLLALGMAAAVDDGWRKRLQHELPTRIGATWYRDHLARRTAPLDDRTLAVANARGSVSFMVLHYGQRFGDLDRTEAQQLLMVAMGMFRGAHAGFNLDELY